MTNSKKEIITTRYIIKVKDHLDFHWEHWFEGMTIKHTDDGHTLLFGEVVDQSALHGLLDKIRNLNLILISVQKVENDEEEGRM